jgi:hypothetical protein
LRAIKPNVANRLPPPGQIIVDNDDLAPWLYDAKKLAKRSLAILAGLLMQQKKYERTIVAGIPAAFVPATSLPFLP